MLRGVGCRIKRYAVDSGAIRRGEDRDRNNNGSRNNPKNAIKALLTPPTRRVSVPDDRREPSPNDKKQTHFYLLTGALMDLFFVTKY